MNSGGAGSSAVLRRFWLTLYIPSFLLCLGQGILVPILPLFAHSFGVSFTLVTLAIGVQGVGTVLASVPSGFFMARAGGRRLMLVGTTIVALSSLALPFSGIFSLVVLYRFIGGIGAALWSISRFTLIAESIPLEQRGRASALFGGVNRAGMFIGPVMGGLLAEHVGLAVALLSSAATGVLAVLVTYCFIRTELKPTSDVRGPSMLRPLITGVRQRPLEITTASVAQLLVQFLRTGRTTLLPMFGSFVIGLDVGTVGIIVGASALIDMILFFPAGMIMDRFGRKFASVPAFLLLSIGMALVAFSSDAMSLFVAAAVMSVGNGLGSGSMMTLGADLAPVNARGEFLGFWRFVGDSGSAGGPVLVGGIADLWSLHAAALAVAGLGAIAVITLAFLVPETLRSRATKSDHSFP